MAAGLPRDHDVEVLRKIVMVNLMGILGAFFMFILGFFSFLNHHYELFAIVYISGIFLLSLIYWFRFTPDTELPVNLGVLLTSLLYLFLVTSGAGDQSTYVWSFTYPIITIFLKGNRLGIIISLVFLLLVLTVFLIGHVTPLISPYPLNLIIRFIGTYLVVTLFSAIIEKTREKVQATLQNSNSQLMESIEKIKTLSGLLPICTRCKKIRDDKGYWNQIESYIEQYSRAEFSHSVCPDCSDELYGNENWFKDIE